MILFKRSDVYYIKLVDEFGNEKRISTKAKKKVDAIKFLTNYKEKLIQTESVKKISLYKVIKIYKSQIESNCSKKYFTNLDYTFTPFKNVIGDIPITNINSHHIQKFIHDKILEDKIYMAHQLFRNLKVFFNWLEFNNYIISSPLKKLKPPKLPEAKPLWITPDQLQTILSFVTDNTLKDIFTILFYTGMRANELLSLDWKNIELDNKLIHIRNSDIFRTKTGGERSIPMNPKVYLIIQRQPTRFIGGLLFVNKNKVKFNKLAIKILQTVIPKSHLPKGVKFKDGFLEINPAKVINNLYETDIDIIITDFSIQENEVEIRFEV